VGRVVDSRVGTENFSSEIRYEEDRLAGKVSFGILIFTEVNWHSPFTISHCEIAPATFMNSDFDEDTVPSSAFFLVFDVKPENPALDKMSSIPPLFPSDSHAR